jgi:hypothetical protein
VSPPVECRIAWYLTGSQKIYTAAVPLLNVLRNLTIAALLCFGFYNSLIGKVLFDVFFDL